MSAAFALSYFPCQSVFALFSSGALFSSLREQARREAVPMAMDAMGTVQPEAMRLYQSFVAGPEINVMS